jgi:uncharacterized protein (TIRG00374 family)
MPKQGPPSPIRKSVTVLLQLSVTAGLLAWIFRSPETRAEAAEVMQQAKVNWILLGVILAGLENFLGVLRWRIFLKMLGIQISFGKTVQIYLLGLFFNIFLIGAVGGDAVKALVLIGRGHGRSAAFLSVILDRVSGLGALILTTGIFVTWNYEWLTSSPIVSGVIHFVFAYLVVVATVLSASFLAAHLGYTRTLPKWFPQPEAFGRLCESYFLFVRHWKSTLAAAGISVVILWCYYLVYYCSALAFGCPVSVSQMFGILPAVDVISAIPVSIGGVGVRDQLFVTILGELAEVPAGQAVWVGLVGYAMAAFWGVVGTLTLPALRGMLRKGQTLEAQQKK